MEKIKLKRKVNIEKGQKTNFSLSKWLLIILLITNNLYLMAQTPPINMSMYNVSMHDILLEIKKQSGKNIIYNNNLIEKYSNESIELKNASLEDALKKLLERKELKYSIIDDVIIVEPVNKKQNYDKPKVLTQTIKGTVFDIATKTPLIGANIILERSNPFKGAISDENGHFKIEKVFIGRYNLSVSYIGYTSYIAREILVGSGKEVIVNIGLRESVTQLDEIKVKSNSNKERPINSMATLSARQFSVEEANRYAGGIDDPSRLVSSYAGVAVPSLKDNGIVIRGNAPKGLLWRMEGVEIPCPNHFSEYMSPGGGIFTALSSQTMANSDFYTGAFPAEFGNAISGVFDINMRTGNTEKREYTFQVGVLGIDFAAEGPFVKEKNSSYLFNYRYSATGLITQLVPEEMDIEIIKYQDISFKMNFVTKKTGSFTFWGIGLLNHLYFDPDKDPALMRNSWQRDFKLSMGAMGITHKKTFGNKTYLQTTFAPSGKAISWTEGSYNNNLDYDQNRKISDYNWKYTLTSSINYKFNAKHTNRTGFNIDRLMYSIENKNRQASGGGLTEVPTVHLGDGSSYLFQFFSQSKLNVTDNFIVNAGLHSQYFMLNKKYTIEPRLGIRWNFSPRQAISFAYGLHSQLENLNIYMAMNLQKRTPNKNLDFDKAHHFVIGYDLKISDHVVFKMEPYYQKLFNFPVIPNFSFSTINLTDMYLINDSLTNNGTGSNIGIDFTLERFLHKGYYYLLTASIFDSKYTGGDRIERNTKYNKNYIINLVAGKEWFTGDKKNNILGTNIRFTYMGGNWIDALDMAATIEQQEIRLDRTKAFSNKLPDSPILSLSILYRKNKPNYSSVWSFQIINALCYREFSEYSYNIENHKVEEIRDLVVFPILSYKIEF